MNREERERLGKLPRTPKRVRPLAHWEVGRVPCTSEYQSFTCSRIRDHEGDHIAMYEDNDQTHLCEDIGPWNDDQGYYPEDDSEDDDSCCSEDE